MKDSLLLVFANKQDLKEGTFPSPLATDYTPSQSSTCIAHLLVAKLTGIAMKPQEVTEKLQLSKLKDKVWYVVPSCATTGEGLLEGLAWLSNNVKAPPAPAKK